MRREQRAPDAKQLGPSDQGDQAGGGMDANRLAHDARSNDIALDDMHQHEVAANQEGPRLP